MITALKNDKIKQLKKLSARKERQKQQRYLIEGWHLLQEALAYQAPIIELFVTEQAALDLRLRAFSALKQEIISDEVAQFLGETVQTQGVFAVLKLIENDVTLSLTNGSWLLLDGLQDPGNLGTIIRTADAAGMTGVILGEGTVDLYNPKVIRSAQGSHFHFPIQSLPLVEVIKAFKAEQIPVYGTELNPQAVSYRTIEPSDQFALVLGNEGNGLQDKILKMTTKNLYIPIKGSAESLNVAIAAGVLMFALKH